jgi:hypothetical protein
VAAGAGHAEIAQRSGIPTGLSEAQSRPLDALSSVTVP